MSRERRVERLEQHYTWAIVAETAQEYGVRVVGLLEDTSTASQCPRPGREATTTRWASCTRDGSRSGHLGEGGTIMHDHRRRLDRLDWQHIRRLAAEAGQPFGFTADDILEEARRIFALPEAAQCLELHRVSTELTPEEARELDGIRARDARLLRQRRARERG
jgi:hypothetical protein